MITLGIETSCDETSIAIFNDEHLIVNEIFTQKEHAQYGGVVPEIASRAHLQKIDRLCEHALTSGNIACNDIGLLAVTDSPGLAGALLVGICFASGLSSRYGIPCTGVNHLEGHIFSVAIEHPDIPFPFLALVVSGGHTAIYMVKRFGNYQLMGQTIDDAAGEAFDKVGKMVGFTYPAGRAIESAAALANTDVPRFPIAKLTTSQCDFSFSGLKTAAKNYIEQNKNQPFEELRPAVCAGVQNAIVEALVNNCVQASKQTGILTFALVGGVACNNFLRTAMQQRLGKDNVFFPTPKMCTDNAAMIAKTGIEMYRNGLTRPPIMDPSKTPGS